jgi:hypothetical protein
LSRSDMDRQYNFQTNLESAWAYLSFPWIMPSGILSWFNP